MLKTANCQKLLDLEIKFVGFFLIDYQRNFEAKHFLKGSKRVGMPNSESDKEADKVLTA